VSRLPDHHLPSKLSLTTGPINLLHLGLSAASSLLIPSSFRSQLITSIQVIFGLPLQFGPCNLGYSIHLFVQSSSGFLCTCPNHFSLFLCSTVLMLSIPSLFLSSVDGTLSRNLLPHIHLTILISVRSSVLSGFLVIGHVSLPCSMLLLTALVYTFPRIINDVSFAVRTGANCLTPAASDSVCYC